MRKASATDDGAPGDAHARHRNEDREEPQEHVGVRADRDPRADRTMTSASVGSTWAVAALPMNAATAPNIPMPSEVPIATRGGTRSKYTRTARMKAIAAMPTMP